ncbi:GPI mannosyltransferase 2 [Apodospora peruviana]|uniref:GPI mannosyltransferase 2 n=1 Tax=Apodospora peruviana TaxID=516989 RepID=A0AAE0I170_9PEZI|nr:GPI mannosyltransferase 2 [Apodospora peruviana]
MSGRIKPRLGGQDAPQPTTSRPKSPYWTLITAFAGWKLFLFIIAAGSTIIGDAYDTSGGLVVLGHENRNQHHLHLGKRLIARLTSWDAIYFVSVARRDYRFEQEWAFGSGLPLAIRAVLPFLALFGVGITDHHHHGVGERLGDDDGAGRVPEALAGVLVANAAHLLSVLVLYRLSQLIWPPADVRGDRDRTKSKSKLLLPLVAALLHIISPAGVFLSAPYAESSCSLFSFAGYLFYAHSCLSSSAADANAYILLSGLAFGIATLFRSNAILNGIPFAWEVFETLPRLFRRPAVAIPRLLALGVGGVLVALGSIVPQAVAYQRFCLSGTPSGGVGGGGGGDLLLPRPPAWCQGLLPSIYTFVQQHYWNTGFLRYWTVPNIPLFLLAAPMLAILAKSGAEQLLPLLSPASAAPAGDRQLLNAADQKRLPDPEAARRLSTLVRSAAAAQVLLAMLAVSTYHVQIITRISSGYPLWYWWLADHLITDGGESGSKSGSRVVVFMVLYASIQGVLFTSFLPPA